MRRVCGIVPPWCFLVLLPEIVMDKPHSPPCTLLLRFGLCGPRGVSDCGYWLVGWIDSSGGDYRRWARDDLMVMRSVVWR